MILVDGMADAALPADDRGLAYGDGAFETARIVDGRVPWIERHLARLGTACAALGFAAPLDALRGDAARLAEGQARGVLKLVATRGSGGRGYAPPAAPAARRVVVRHPWPAHPVERWSAGVKVRWCATRVPSCAPLAGLKHLNRLPQVLARREWDDPEVVEGLLLDSDGRVAEATACNLFLAKDGALVTPRIEGGAVAGLARAFILERAAGLGLAAEERAVSRSEVEAADELLLCNAVIGVWPVRELEGRRFQVGAAARALQALLAGEGLGP